MAVEDLEPLTKSEQKDGREAETDGKDTGDSLNVLLTSALHKHAAKKLAKLFIIHLQYEHKNNFFFFIRKKKESKFSKAKKSEDELELREVTVLKEKKKGKKTVQDEGRLQQPEEAEDENLHVLETGKEEDDKNDEEVPHRDSCPSGAEIDSPTRDYLKAVSVPKKKTTRKPRRAVRDDGKVLGVTVHCADRLEGSPLLLPHPAVQVHICNADTGDWLQKTAPERKVTSYYESNDVDHILPIMTQPYDLRKAKSLHCRWEEQLIFNEPMGHFTSREPQVIVFFQMMDFPPSSANTSNVTSNQTRASAAARGLTTFAWAFLKVQGANNHVNIGQRLRLQLFRPRKQSGIGLKDLHSWWKSGSRTKYPATLYVTLQEMAIPQNPRPALRSMLATQQEQGGGSILMDVLDQSSINGSIHRPSSTHDKLQVSWSRKPNQSCKIPNHVRHCLSYTDQGCLVVKFSNSGLKLACGAYKQILVYDVFSGQLELSLSGHLGLVYDASWSDSDELLLTASADSTARVWNTKAEEGCGHGQVLAHPSYVYTARFVPSRHQVIVTGCYDHVLRVWCSSKGGGYGVVQELTNHLGFINALCFNPEGDLLYSGDKQGIILVWKVSLPKKDKGKKKIKPLTFEHEVKIPDILGNTINTISFHPGGYRLLVHTRDSQIRLVNHVHWTVTHRLRGLLNVREQIRGCVSPCGTWVLSGSEDHGVYIWNSDTGEMVSAFMDLPIDGTISCIDYHPHEHMVALCSYSNEAPVLILDYDEDTQVANTTVPLAVQPAGSVRAHSPMLRSPSPSFTPRKLSSSPHRNYTSTSMDRSASSVPQSEALPYKTRPLEPSSFQHNNMHGDLHNMALDREASTKRNTDNSLGGKDLWSEQGKRILSKLDTVLKMASENPIGLNDSSVNHYGDDLVPLGQLATVLYDYHSVERDELSVKQGDYVMVIQETNSDWWLVRTADQRLTGLVPASYLQHLHGGIRVDDDDIDWIDSGNVIAIPSECGEVSFISDSEGTPSKARARRHKAKMGGENAKVITSTPRPK
ncbi:jouberin-like [Penaeus monodon]|uniref:jouberin-like n=1 Tax=Penaeus monodon TaxID=6687 RepID=UPI0018A71082|nr:jouberin-like [Penaeus monodon]